MGLLLAEATDPWALTQPTFFVSALGRVPKWGSAALSTGLLMSEGTDSVLRILATEEGEPSAGTRLSQRKTHPKRRRRRRERARTHSEGRISGRRAPPLYTCCGTSTWQGRQGSAHGGPGPGEWTGGTALRPGQRTPDRLAFHRFLDKHWLRNAEPRSPVLAATVCEHYHVRLPPAQSSEQSRLDCTHFNWSHAGHTSVSLF